MAIYDSNDKIQKWRYTVKDMKLLINGETTVIPSERLQSITIEHDYLNNLYPILKLELIISSESFYKIQANKNKLKFFIRIDKSYFFDDKSAKADGSTNSVYKPWINDTFDIIMDTNTENLKSAEEREATINDYTKLRNDYSDNLDKIDNGVELYLYKTVNAFKKNVNKIFTKVNVTDAITWLLSEAGLKNVVMQQPDNSKVYEDFIIPPLSISKALYFIDTYYGIYKLGTMFYSDFDYTYIIPFDASKRTAFINNDTKVTNIVIPSSENKGHSKAQGVLKKANGDNSNYIIGNQESLQISNTSISNDLISGSDAKSIDTFSGGATSATSGATTKTGNAVTQVMTNPTMNDFYSSMKSAVAKSLSTEIGIVTADFDVDMINPNKTYTMMFENSEYTKKYNGKYMITKAIHSFLKEGESLTVQSELVLRKMK